MTKIIGIAFLLTLVLLAIIVDVFNWHHLVYGIPVILLELMFFVSLGDDLANSN